jgi:cellulose synthase/poly-beta-1,6-N-acetylglucosamine synthase-like glycosyltransferase
MKPDVSIVIVSDYAAGGAKTWNDLRRLFAAMAKQDYAGQAEFLFCENANFNGKILRDLIALLLGLRIVLVEESGSYELKNAGMHSALADLAVILDADCLPDPDWLQMLVNSMNTNPEGSVISGKTVYAGQGLGERMLSLLSRSYVDAGQAGVTRFISNNNAAWRREVFLAHPFLQVWAPLREECSLNLSVVQEANCSLSLGCVWYMILKVGRWRSISDAIAGMARLSRACMIVHCPLPG